jgi:predicted Zn-dependent protease
LPETLPLEPLAAFSPEPAHAPTTSSAPKPPKAFKLADTSLDQPNSAPSEKGKDIQAIEKARETLSHGSLTAAMNEYSRLIKKGKQLDDVIYDLKDAVYTHPVDVILWQTLGEAYFRANRLQEALDAYSKAESLLR